jgi:RNA polymerase sigma-70 factor (ECF subfamily)
VQDACVRALRFFSSLRDDNARAWLMTIVRNTWYSRFSRIGASEPSVAYDEMKHHRSDEGLDAEALMLQRQAIDTVRRAIEALPNDFREVIVLRELEGMSYREIAAVVGTPIGTVMSRLARGRERLLVILGRSATMEGHRDVS